MSDQIGKLLERVAFDLGGSEDSMEILGYLEERLGPLLRAGQAMRERLAVLSDEVGASEAVSSMAWDAALEWVAGLALEGRDGE